MKYDSAKNDGVLVIHLSERRLDAANAKDVKEDIATAIEEGESRIVLDMGTVDFIDSSGLGALVGLLKRIGTRGDLALSSLKPPVQKAFKLTRMDRVFRIFPDSGSALVDLKG